MVKSSGKRLRRHHIRRRQWHGAGHRQQPLRGAHVAVWLRVGFDRLESIGRAHERGQAHGARPAGAGSAPRPRVRMIPYGYPMATPATVLVVKDRKTSVIGAEVVPQKGKRWYSIKILGAIISN